MKRRDKHDTKADGIDKLKDANKKIRSENRSLRKDLKKAHRDLTRLRKELNKVSGATEDLQLDLDIKELDKFEPLQVEVLEGSTHNLTCPNCNSHNILEVEAGLFTIEKCEDCGSRRSKKL